MRAAPVVDDMDMSIILPYPPSVNTYWRNWRGRMVISTKGRAYKSLVETACEEQGVEQLRGPVAVAGVVVAPDRRRRDLDNLWKALLDALKGLAFEDDSMIHRLGPLEWEKMGGQIAVAKGGVVRLWVRSC
jgi:crossover junction endodeoxyribonuclease RusA